MNQIISIFFLLWLRLKVRLNDLKALFLEIIIHFFGNITAFIGYYLLVSKFSIMGSLNTYEAGILYGIVSLGFGVSKFLLSGFDDLVGIIQNGTFSLYLTKPLNILYRVPISGLRFSKIGKILEALFVLILCMKLYSKVTVLPFLILCLSSIIFYAAIFLFYYSVILLYPIKGVMSLQILTQLISTINRYPLIIFGPIATILMSKYIPLGYIHYYPLKALFMQSEANSLVLFSVFISIVTFVLSSLVIKLSLKRHMQTTF